MQISSSPLVSVIMPAWNCERYIGSAIQSVVKQTRGDWELVVVDDASTDATLRIVSEFTSADKRIKVTALKEPVGPARARNLAIQQSAGRYIAFLDSDDLWLPMKLEIQIKEMEKTSAILSFTAYKKIDAQGNVGHTIIQVPPTVSYGQLLKTNVIGCLTAMYDTRALGKMYMPEDLRREDYRLWLQILKLRRHHEDYALWLAILRKMFSSREDANKKVAIGINEVLAHYRVHNQSVSSNKFRAAAMQWAVYRRVEKLSLLRSLFYFLHYAYHGYRKSKLR